MLLKKQTVWLLTMLSLVVVLSVYYVSNDDMYVSKPPVEDTSGQTDTNNTESTTGNTDNEIITNMASDPVFEQVRLDIADERSKAREELVNVMASTTATAEEKSAAKDKMDGLRDVTNKEELLETLIVSMNYDDALVRIGENNDVVVTLRTEKLDRSQANQIMRQVRNELGTNYVVSVEYQPKN